MKEQPEALRLAERLEDTESARLHLMPYAAAELRRLSAVEAQRDALLEALKMAQFQIENQCDVGVDEWIACSKKVRAAIAKAEGEKA